MMQALLLFGPLLLVGFTVLAQERESIPLTTASVQNTPALKRPGAAFDDRYKIGPGDLLEIRIFKHAELSRDAVRVDARGMIRMPLVKDEIQAACRTEGELENEIGTKYRKYLLEPQVSVFVKEFQSQPVAVLGAVKSPGRLVLQRRVRLLELLSLVGGATDQAGNTVQVIHEDKALICESTTEEGSDTTKASGVIFYELSATLRGEMPANPYVQPGDIITIPPADEALIVGNVLKPSAIPLREPITLTRAIALAGGVLQDTDQDRVHIVRHTQGTDTIDIYIDLKAVNNRRAKDLLLEPNDIIEVRKKSGAAQALKDLLRTVVPSAASIPIRVIP